MKRVPKLAALTAAVFYFLSVSAQNMGDRASIFDSAAYNASNYFEDSVLVYNYISLSKNNVSKNPDSSLAWADLAIKIALQINNLQLVADVVEQKHFVQESNTERIKNRMLIFNNRINAL